MKLVSHIAAFAAGALALGACADEQMASNDYQDPGPTPGYSSDMTSPDSDVAVPGTASPGMASPAAPAPGALGPDSSLGTTATLPPGATRNPDGTITYPDGTIRNPDGTLVRPNGVTTDPSGTIPPAVPPAAPITPPN
jgi:hypothetical protein